ncbi:MAG: ThuA domain-containing protein [Gemmatimonadales bacterium]
MLAATTITVTLGCASPGDSGAQVAESWVSCHPPVEGNPRVLVFTRTTGFRHGSIPAGVQAVRLIGAQLGFGVEHTEDPERFTTESLAPFAAVIFLNTTGDILEDAQQAAFEAFIQDGGGFVGVHSAADTEYDWPWYGRLMGAWFARHPAIQEGRLSVADSTHPSTRCLPDPWVRVDEWYDFRSQPPDGASILLMIDESSYNGGRMGSPHPMAWSREVDGGRAWYTALGHTAESYSEPAFLDHLAGGIVWAVGAGRGRP